MEKLNNALTDLFGEDFNTFPADDRASAILEVVGTIGVALVAGHPNHKKLGAQLVILSIALEDTCLSKDMSLRHDEKERYDSVVDIALEQLDLKRMKG